MRGYIKKTRGQHCKNYVQMIILTKKSEKTYGSCQIMLEWISKQSKQQKCDKKWGMGQIMLEWFP